MRELKQQTKEQCIYQCISVGVQEEGRPPAALFSVTAVSVSLSSTAEEPHPTRYMNTVICTALLKYEHTMSFDYEGIIIFTCLLIQKYIMQETVVSHVWSWGGYVDIEQR